MTSTPIPEPALPTAHPVYNRVFWLAYAANLCMVTANALTFRFAEFVVFLGGSESVTGAVVSTGAVAAVLVRLRLGRDIDGHGPRRLWGASAVLFVIGCAAFPLIGRIAWPLFVARIAFNVGLAGMFTSVVAYVQRRVPPDRRTEAIAALGSSGFLGMILGTVGGDLIFAAADPGRMRYALLFGSAALLGAAHLALVCVLTRGDRVVRRRRRPPPAHRLVARYWPGPVVGAALVFGATMAVPTVFLTRFVTERGLGGIGPFFFAYCVCAGVLRVVARRWSHTVGRHRMIMLGLGAIAAAQMMLPHAASAWHLLAPAVVFGFGHAVVFPAAVSLVSEAFPRRHQGMGTTVALGFIESGVIVGSPVLGAIIDRAGFAAMFYSAAAVILAAVGGYALTAAKRPDAEGVARRPAGVAGPARP